MKKLNCYLMATILLATASCKKESTEAVTTKTPKEVLMASTWKKSEYKENGTTMAFFGACEMDDVLSFTTTNATIDDGANKCSGFTSGTDTYFIDADNKTMRWTYGAGELSFNADKTSFTFKRTGANTFEYIFTKR